MPAFRAFLAPVDAMLGEVTARSGTENFWLAADPDFEATA